MTDRSGGTASRHGSAADAAATERKAELVRGIYDAFDRAYAIEDRAERSAAVWAMLDRADVQTLADLALRLGLRTEEGEEASREEERRAP
jgi:hypothetical protein